MFFSFGIVIKYTGRVPIFVGGALINILVIIIFFTWTPNPHQVFKHQSIINFTFVQWPLLYGQWLSINLQSFHIFQAYVFFIMAALWGVADAVWQTQINGECYLKFSE